MMANILTRRYYYLQLFLWSSISFMPSGTWVQQLPIAPLTHHHVHVSHLQHPSTITCCIVHPLTLPCLPHPDIHVHLMSTTAIRRTGTVRRGRCDPRWPEETPSDMQVIQFLHPFWNQELRLDSSLSLAFLHGGRDSWCILHHPSSIQRYIS